MKKMFIFAAVMMFMLSAITLIGCSKEENVSSSEVPSEVETTVEATTELQTTEPETTEYFEETTFQLETVAHRNWDVEYDENGMPILVPRD